MPIPILPLALMAASVVGAKHFGDKRRENEASAAETTLLAKENRATARKRAAEMAPKEIKAFAPYLKSLGIADEPYTIPAGIESEAEKDIRVQREKATKFQKVLSGILTGQPALGPKPFGGADRETMSMIPGHIPPATVQAPIVPEEIAKKIDVGIGPKGLTGAYDPSKDGAEPVDLQLKSMEWIDANDVIWTQKANYNKETGTLTPLEGTEPTKSPKNTQKTPSVSPIGADNDGQPIFASTQRNADGSVNVTYADGRPFAGKLAPLKGARLSPESQKFMDDLKSIERDADGITDFMTKTASGKLLFDRDKKGKIVYDKSLTGPIQGRLRNWLSVIKNDPRFARFKHKVARLRSIVYGLSGKQINKSELEWLRKKILPNFNQPDENFIAVLFEVVHWVKQKRSISAESYESMGYIIGGPGDETHQGTVADLLGEPAGGADDLEQFFNK